MSDSEEPIESPDGGDDLFGDGDSAALSDQEQPLSDHGLDSDHDEAPQQQYGEEEAEAGDGREVKTKIIMGVQMFRHVAPKPHDGTVWHTHTHTRPPPARLWVMADKQRAAAIAANSRPS